MFVWQTVKGNRHALESVLTSVCESKEILRSVVAAQLCCEYEDRVGVVPEASPASVLYHSTLRSLWHATFPAEDEVSVVDFLAALKEFVSSVVLLSADDVETMFHVGGKAALQNNICFAYPANNRVS